MFVRFVCLRLYNLNYLLAFIIVFVFVFAFFAFLHFKSNLRFIIGSKSSWANLCKAMLSLVTLSKAQIKWATLFYVLLMSHPFRRQFSKYYLLLTNVFFRTYVQLNLFMHDFFQSLVKLQNHVATTWSVWIEKIWDVRWSIWSIRLRRMSKSNVRHTRIFIEMILKLHVVNQCHISNWRPLSEGRLFVSMISVIWNSFFVKVGDNQDVH